MDKLGSMAPLDLNLDLGKEREQELVSHVCQEIDAYMTATDRRRSNLNTWRLAWELMPPGTANRWENSSDIPSALTRIIANSHHTKLNQQTNATDPPFTAISEDPFGTDPGLEEIGPQIESMMAAVLRQAEWAVVNDDLNRELVIAGNVFVSVKYERETARVPERTVHTDDDAHRSLLQAGVDPEEAAWHSVKRLSFQHVDKASYDGVRFKVIPFEDGLICPANARDPENAIGIGELKRLRGADLLEGVRAGYYREDAVEDLLRNQGDPEPQQRQNRKDEQGISMDAQQGMGGGLFDRLYRQYEIHELCWQFDADDDDRLEWVILYLHKPTRKIIGLRWLDYDHGKPYYSMLRYIVRTGELFAMGIPELLQPYQDADTNVTNQEVDHADLNLNLGGNFAYTRLSGYNPDAAILQLGRPLLFETLGDSDFRQLQPLPLPAEHYHLSDKFKNLCELLTASSNPSLGKSTDTSKTLGEVQIVTNASNQIFEDYGARVARQLAAKLWEPARSLTAQFAPLNPDGTIGYRHVEGPDQSQYRSIAPATLKANVRLIPTGLVQLGDLGARIQQATLIFTQVMQLVATFAPCQGNVGMVRVAWQQYMRSLKYPVMEKLMAEFDKGVALFQQQQMMMQQMAMAQAQMGGAPGAGGPPPGGPPPGGPPGQAGMLGGPPAPIPQPPEMPSGGIAQQNFLPTPEGP